MHSRIVTGPVHAKLLAQLLADAIARFEAEHGEIADLAEPALEPLLAPGTRLRAPGRAGARRTR